MPSGSDAMRIRKLLEDRERHRLENLETMKRIQAEEKMKPQQIADKFSSYKDEVEDQIKASTVGLVSLQQMKEKTNKILEDRDLRAVKDRAIKLEKEMKKYEAREKMKATKRKEALSKLSFGDEHEEEDSDSGDENDHINHSKKQFDEEMNKIKLLTEKKIKEREILKQSLPPIETTKDYKDFISVPGYETEKEKIEQSERTTSRENSKEETEDKEPDSFKPKRIRLKYYGKKTLRNSEADSSYLPNAAQNEDELELRKQLREEWEEKQRVEKNAIFNLPFLYWDGIGHPFEVAMKKGNTIYQFLSRAIESIKQDFPEMAKLTPEHLIFIKDDLILPPYYTFYDLVMNKIVSKGGNLLAFETIDQDMTKNEVDQKAATEMTNVQIDQNDDIEDENGPRKVLNINHFKKPGLKNKTLVFEEDASQNIGRVILRNWYEKNKHIFPASRWEAFDPVTMVKVDNLIKPSTIKDDDYYKMVL